MQSPGLIHDLFICTIQTPGLIHDLFICTIQTPGLIHDLLICTKQSPGLIHDFFHRYGIVCQSSCSKIFTYFNYS